MMNPPCWGVVPLEASRSKLHARGFSLFFYFGFFLMGGGHGRCGCCLLRRLYVVHDSHNECEQQVQRDHGQNDLVLETPAVTLGKIFSEHGVLLVHLMGKYLTQNTFPQPRFM